MCNFEVTSENPQPTTRGDDDFLKVVLVLPRSSYRCFSSSSMSFIKAVRRISGRLAELGLKKEKLKRIDFFRSIEPSQVTVVGLRYMNGRIREVSECGHSWGSSEETPISSTPNMMGLFFPIYQCIA